MVVFRIDTIAGVPVFFTQVIFRYYLDQLASIFHLVADWWRTHELEMVPPELPVECCLNCWEPPIF